MFKGHSNFLHINECFYERNRPHLARGPYVVHAWFIISFNETVMEIKMFSLHVITLYIHESLVTDKDLKMSFVQYQIFVQLRMQSFLTSYQI